VNGIVLISFSACSSLVYRRATDFCMLVIYISLLCLKYLSHIRILWLGSSASLKYRISSINRDYLTSFFTIALLLWLGIEALY
jgi:hypothetical protein